MVLGFAGAAIVAFGVPSAASAAAPAPTVLHSYNYAGYAAYPASGDVGNVQATWNVPDITCPAKSYSQPRAAAWTGMWGGTTSINNGTAYVAQIGTVSDCLLSSKFPYTSHPVYTAFWEIEGAHGNLPQTIGSVPVHPNDTIVASVAYLGATDGKQDFEMWIHDMTDNKYAQGDVQSAVAVPLGSIIRQGGAIVEYEPPCSWLTWPPDLCELGGSNGLARFSPPVRFTSVFVSAEKGAKLPWKYFEYVMGYGKGGPQLAANSPITFNNGGAMNYTITWKAQN